MVAELMNRRRFAQFDRASAAVACWVPGFLPSARAAGAETETYEQIMQELEGAKNLPDSSFAQ